MQPCPRCGAELVVTNPLGPTFWVERCPACGHEGGGTVSFAIPEEPDAERLVSGFFRLSSLAQYPVLRMLLPALASVPAGEIVGAPRAEGLRWHVGPLKMREARRSQSEAAEQGVEFVILCPEATDAFYVAADVKPQG